MYYTSLEEVNKHWHEQATQGDIVNNPTHYSHNRKGIECIQAIEACMTKEQFIGWLKGQVMKYIWRFEYKQKPLEDCKKAEFYLKRLIKELE
jgi:hypothetical protein